MGDSNPYAPPRGVISAYDVYSGQTLLDTSAPAAGPSDVEIYTRVSSVALSHDGAVLVAVAATQLYVFRRDPSGLFHRPPEVVILGEYSETVAIHPGGEWAVTADQKGRIYLIDITSAGLAVTKWSAPLEDEQPGDPQTIKVPIKFHSVAISRDSEVFGAVGPNHIYCFTPASLKAGAPIGDLSTVDSANKGHDSRWVAVADDGSFMTAILNAASPKDPGSVWKISTNGGAGPLTKVWEQQVDHAPNSTSIDSSGDLITVADGWPNHTQGSFYLFRGSDGTLLRRYDVTPPEMNWPMQVSANGAGIVAGSDNNTLFFFRP